MFSIGTQEDHPHHKTLSSLRLCDYCQLLTADCRLHRRRVRQAACAVAILLGLWQTWSSRHFMNIDGVSYLDIGDAYWRGDFAAAVNSYWSPLYSWLTGLTLKIFNPSFRYESIVIHLLNFFIYLFALTCFEFLLRGINGKDSAIATTQDNAAPEAAVSPLPHWVVDVTGYALFIWSSLTIMPITSVNPDLLFAAFTYLAAGILLRIRKDNLVWLRFAGLGLVLGLGYLAKAPMFPFAFLFLATSAFAAGTLRRAVPGLLLALLCFSLLALPFIAAISKKQGHWTFGDSGSLNYAWLYNGSGDFIHKHPAQLLFDAPKVYEFAMPISGTYPLWYDPPYWNEGISITSAPYDRLRAQIELLAFNAKEYYQIFFASLSFFFAIWLVIICANFRGRQTLKEMVAPYRLLLPSLVVLTGYAFFVVQSRYVIPFVVLLCMGSLSGVRLPENQTNRRWSKAIAVSMAVMFAIATLFVLLQQARFAYTTGYEGDIRIAAALKTMGIQGGEKAAFVGEKNPFYWARLAHIRVVAEIGEADKFWAADEGTKSRLWSKLKEAGIALLVTNKPMESAMAGWQTITGTDYAVYRLTDSSKEQTE
jgi:hypothetical protein